MSLGANPVSQLAVAAQATASGPAATRPAKRTSVARAHSTAKPEPR